MILQLLDKTSNISLAKISTYYKNNYLANTNYTYLLKKIYLQQNNGLQGRCKGVTTTIITQTYKVKGKIIIGVKIMYKMIP